MGDATDNLQRDPLSSDAAPDARRTLLGWAGGVILLASLAPIPLWLLVVVAFSAGAEPFADDLWTLPPEEPASSLTPNPASAPLGSLSFQEKLVYLDPWLGVLYPLWAVPGAAIGLSLLLISRFRQRAPHSSTRWPTPGQWLLLALLLLLWSAVPFVVGLWLVFQATTPDWSFGI